MTAASSIPTAPASGPRLRVIKGPRWTAEEDAIIRACYLRSRKACARQLPHRTMRAIETRAKAIRVVRVRAWTELADRILRSEWGFASLVNIGRQTGHSPRAVWSRGKKLGLGAGVPEGALSLDAAAERSGFSRWGFLSVMRFARVKLPQMLTRHHGKPKHRRYYVMPEQVDAAVAKWLAAETVNTAARRRGVSEPALRRWLRAAGVPGPAPGSRHVWRVATEVIDRVAAEHAESHARHPAARRAMTKGAEMGHAADT